MFYARVICKLRYWRFRDHTKTALLVPSKLNRITFIHSITFFSNSPCKSLSRLLAVCVHSSSTLLVWEGRGEGRGARSPFVQIYQPSHCHPHQISCAKKDGGAHYTAACEREQRLKELYREETLQRNTTTRRETKPPS